jgi:urease accessory protein
VRQRTFCPWHSAISCFDVWDEMKRVIEIRLRGEWTDTAVDFVILDAHDRHRRRIVFVGEHGATYLLDLPRSAQLRDGDGLLLEDGSLVRVTGKAEALMEISASSPEHLARLAWHLGNRHTEVHIVGEALRIRSDHVLEDMLLGLGAQLKRVEAIFEPEGGAYNAQGHGHQHNGVRHHALGHPHAP